MGFRSMSYGVVGSAHFQFESINSSKMWPNSLIQSLSRSPTSRTGEATQRVFA